MVVVLRLRQLDGYQPRQRMLVTWFHDEVGDTPVGGTDDEVGELAECIVVQRT